MGVARVDVEATKKAQEKAKKKAKEDTDNLATGVGLALAEWGLVETFLTFIFVAVLDRSSRSKLTGQYWHREPVQNRIAHVAFNAIISFDTRVDVVTAAVEESDLSKRLKAIWPGVAARLKKNYRKRHETAHFMFDAMQERDGSLKVMLTPFASTVFRYDSKQLTRADIDHKAERFRELGEALRWFRTQIDHQRRRLKGPREPAPSLVVRVLQSLKTRSATKPK